MPVTISLNEHETQALLKRKDQRVETISVLARKIGIPIGYFFDMVVAARDAGVRSVELLELLVELEAIKYTLCARRLREELGE